MEQRVATYASGSKPLICELKAQLHTLNRDNVNIENYVQKAKGLQIGLTALQHPINNEDLVEFDLVGVLSACGPTGLINKGMEHFYSMARDYGIVTNTRHYTCIIDLLGRARRLDDAQNLMIVMPCEPDVATWSALLEASRIHGNTELGEKAAEMIFILESWNAGMYAPLTNLYVASGRWRDVSKMKNKNEGHMCKENAWLQLG